MKRILTFILIITWANTFGQKKKEIKFPPPVLGMEYPQFMNACYLPAHKKELVYTRFIYSGVEEYWGLRAEKNCNKINAYLDIPDNVDIKPEYIKKLQHVHNNYMREYLIIDLIGTFDDSNPSGYGHLGSNNSIFTVKYIVDINSLKTN